MTELDLLETQTAALLRSMLKSSVIDRISRRPSRLPEVVTLQVHRAQAHTREIFIGLAAGIAANPDTAYHNTTTRLDHHAALTRCQVGITSQF